MFLVWGSHHSYAAEDQLREADDQFLRDLNKIRTSGQFANMPGAEDTFTQSINSLVNLKKKSKSWDIAEQIEYHTEIFKMDTTMTNLLSSPSENSKFPDFLSNVARDVSAKDKCCAPSGLAAFNDAWTDPRITVTIRTKRKSDLAEVGGYNIISDSWLCRTPQEAMDHWAAPTDPQFPPKRKINAGNVRFWLTRDVVSPVTYVLYERTVDEPEATVVLIVPD